jgi:hypothetical protein
MVEMCDDSMDLDKDKMYTTEEMLAFGYAAMDSYADLAERRGNRVGRDSYYWD